jgi:ATP-binding cassette subfamily B protein
LAQSGQEFANEVARIAGGRTRSRSLRPLGKLLPFLRPYRGRIAIALIALVVASAATLAVAPAVRQMVDHGFTKAQAGRIGQYFLFLLGVVAVMGVSAGVRYFYVTWIGERVIADLRRAVFDHVLTLTPAFFETTRTGEVLSRLTADTTLIQTVVGSSVSIALRNMVTLAGALVMMFVSSLRLSLLVVAAVPLVLVPLLGFGRWVRNLSRKSQDRIADTAARASETLNAVQTVQAFTHEAIDREAFGRDVELSFDIAIRRTWARAFMSMGSTFVSFGVIVAILWVAAHDVLSGAMTAGDLVQFMIYAVLMGSSFAMLSEVWGDLQRAAGASERLSEILNAEPDVKAPANPAHLAATVKGSVRFEDVFFHYPTRPDVAALDGFSLHVAPGEAVALVGPSGAGKSTVFQLLLRFYEPQGGRILFDGTDTSHLDPTELRRHIAVVAQDPAIFSGTIAENIRYGRPDASQDEVRRAAEGAAAAEFIDQLPDGYATKLGERGITLSGGQRQRLAIARAMLRDAPLLLLDEATSALDAENERLVQMGLANLMAGRTTLVIAHRLATIQKLARIIVMDRGKVVAEGSHADLVQGGGLYARLASLQFASGMSLAG